MKLFLPICILLFTVSAFGQSDLPIIGEISQLQGMTKVYIAGATSDERKIVLTAFKKEQKKIPFVVVGDPDEAEFFMNFGELSRQVVANNRSGAYQERDELEVYFYNKDKKKVIVFTDTETLDRTSSGFNFSFPNSFNLTRNFFKAYNKKPK
jgi:hypothetical protein